MKKYILTFLLAMNAYAMNAFTGTYIYNDWNKTYEYSYFSDDPNGVVNKTAKYAKTSNGNVSFEFDYKANGRGNITISFNFDDYKFSADFDDVAVIYDIDSNSCTVVDYETQNAIAYFICSKNLLVIEYLGNFKK